MTIRSRIEVLERRAAVDRLDGPEILLFSGVSRDSDGNITSRPGFARFIGFAKEDLIAIDGETEEQFSARAEAVLEKLKQAYTHQKQKEV